jgi:hypothetical protein
MQCSLLHLVPSPPDWLENNKTVLICGWFQKRRFLYHGSLRIGQSLTRGLTAMEMLFLAAQT